MADGTNESDGEGALFEVRREHIEHPVRRLFLNYGGDRKGLILIGLAGTMLAPIMNLVPPYIMGITIDAVFLQNSAYTLPAVPNGWIPGTRWEQLILSVVLMGGAITLKAGFNWTNNAAWNLFAQHAQHRLRTDAYDKMQRLGMDFFTEQRTGQLLSIINSDVNDLENFLTRILSNIVQLSTRHVAMAVILLSLNWQLALIALIPIPLGGLVSYKFAQIIEPKYQEMRQQVGKLTARVENSVSGIAVVKSFTNEDLEAERVADASRDYREANWDAIRTRITFFPVMDIIKWYGISAVVLVGGYWLIRGPPLFFTLPLTVGTLVTFVMYSQHLIQPLSQAGRVLNNYHDAKASIERVFTLIDHPLDVEEVEDPIDISPVRGRVEYEDVVFSYPQSEETVLRDIDVAVEPGELVGLVGPTGSGKTTLVRLLLRFYDPDEGQIRVDGHDIREVELGSLRGSIGYVSQEPFLFDGTVYENIRYGNPGVEQRSIEEAAEMAGAHEFIEDLEDGYETRVGDRGVKLSGGQRQRIAIARAIVKDPEILILDEATSHVDNETEVVIQSRIEDLIADRTTFVIAHRLSTVRDADQILVLEDGEIIERGSHEELLRGDGLYANLWNVQVGEVEALPEEFVEQTIQWESSVGEND